MSQLHIPDTQLNGLQALLSLDESAFQKAIERISATQPTVTFSKLVHELSKQLSIPRESVLLLLSTLIALHEVSQNSLVLPDQLSKDVADALSEKRNLQAEEKERLRARVEYSLQKTDSLGTLAKARNVLTDNQRTFLECRILSDIRAVYTTSPEAEPGAAVILHTLKLVYWQNFQKEEFFVTLDTEDLKSLRATLERAEKKTASLRDVVVKGGLHYIDLAEE